MTGFVGAIISGLAVAAGAFGAHALKSRLDVSDLAIYETAVRYQFYHGLALIALAAFERAYGVQARVVFLSFLLGVLLFSGSLYMLVFSGVRVLGAVTPFGGVAFLVGWIAFAVLAWKHQ